MGDIFLNIKWGACAEESVNGMSHCRFDRARVKEGDDAKPKSSCEHNTTDAAKALVKGLGAVIPKRWP